MFLESERLWAGNCFSYVITFSALTYRDATDRILALASSAHEWMEKETIELPWRLCREWRTLVIYRGVAVHCPKSCIGGSF